MRFVAHALACRGGLQSAVEARHAPPLVLSRVQQIQLPQQLLDPRPNLLPLTAQRLQFARQLLGLRSGISGLAHGGVAFGESRLLLLHRGLFLSAQPAHSPSPAAPQPSAAQEPKDPQSAKPSPDTKQPEAEKPKAEVVTYEKSGIAEKIAGYLGDKNSEGYGDRRAKIVGLLTEFSVKSGKDLKPEQFADFTAKLDAATAPAEDLS